MHWPASKFNHFFHFDKKLYILPLRDKSLITERFLFIAFFLPENDNKETKSNSNTGDFL